MAGKPTKLPVGCGSGLWWAAGLQDHPQGSALSSASRNKEGKSEWIFSAGSLLQSLHHSLPSPAHLGLQFSFSPSVGSLWGHPDGTRSHLQWESQDKRGDHWTTHYCAPLIWPNIAHQCFWKTAVSHLKPESCEKSSFLQERMMMLRVYLHANVSPWAPVNSSTEPRALPMCGWAQRSQNSSRRFPLTVTTKQIPTQKHVNEPDAILSQ